MSQADGRRKGAVPNGTVRPTATHCRTILAPDAGPSPTHYHAANDVCWHILYGRIQAWFARSDGSDRRDVILEGGDFVYIPSGAIHVIANASTTEEAALIFCYSVWGTPWTPRPCGSTRGRIDCARQGRGGQLRGMPRVRSLCGAREKDA